MINTNFFEGTAKKPGKQPFSKLARFLRSMGQARANGQNDNQGSGIQTMTYQGTNYRTAFAAVACSIVFSAIFMLSSVGPAIA
ncbi:hypothetical protein [Sphingosinithalassobacter portus]|uniref:hypothetical protein n=1 Tax=Stakelama portus TaxID=2676234 RepID=UPI0011AB59BE|nr:hypothetical protein [Sphingosinithalassobacter portus]